jgi:hypothetical protein
MFQYWPQVYEALLISNANIKIGGGNKIDNTQNANEKKNHPGKGFKL